MVIVIIGADQSHQSENIERKKEIFFKRNVKYFDYGLFVISTLILLLCDDFVLTQKHQLPISEIDAFHRNPYNSIDSI